MAAADMTEPCSSLTGLLPDGRVIVVCGRADDAQAWQDLLGPARCLAIALDTAPPQEQTQVLRGASNHLAWQHQAIAGLDGSGWLARPADAFDPDQTATLLFPDPLDPPEAGRRRFGRRHPTWRLFEDKTVVDTLWDNLGIPRAPSIIIDGMADLGPPGTLVDRGAGVVCSCQPIGDIPSAGGDGIWWWRHPPPPATIPVAERGAWRTRLMPLLEGVPTRLHGLVLERRVTPFLPMEIVTLPRPGHGTFLCAGAVPTHNDTTTLIAHTEHIGAGLRERLGYRGGFSVDGVLTTNGFLPTDFNARLTSAMEAAPPHQRVKLHTVNMLTRHGIEHDPVAAERLAADIFAVSEIYTLYGAARRVADGPVRETPVRWDGYRLMSTTSVPADGRLTVTPSPRGWLLTATLIASRLPTRGHLGPLAPEVFRLSDQVLGTDFGNLAPPFGAHVPS
jgi:hypothetical protein